MNKRQIQLQAVRSATNFRRKFDLGESSPINIHSLLVKLDLLTVFTVMSKDFSGMAARFNNNGFLLINSKKPRGRQNFTICHELYHLFVQEDFDFEIISSDNQGVKKDINEQLADAFAVELLIPEKGIQEVLLDQNYLTKNISLDLIIKLEHYFQVSRQSMVYRLINLGLIKLTEEQKKYYFSDVIESAKKRSYQTSLYKETKPRVISSDYHEKAKHLYENEIIGLTDYAKLLNDIEIDIFDLLDNPNQ